MSLIKVTSEELHTLSTNVQSGSNSIQDQLARMQGEVLGVVGGEWQGGAPGQFPPPWGEWRGAARGPPGRPGASRPPWPESAACSQTPAPSTSRPRTPSAPR